MDGQGLLGATAGANPLGVHFPLPALLQRQLHTGLHLQGGGAEVHLQVHGQPLGQQA